MKYQGSCHCGGIKFEAEGELTGAMSCNCSLCQRKGALMWFVPHEQFTLLTPDENAGTYLFNKHVIKHRFCPVCGVAPYSEGVSPQGQSVAAVNIRCLEDIDLEAIPVKHFNGRAI